MLLEHLPPAPARVADLGCGTGTLSVLLAEEGYRVDGLDLSPAMVALAEETTAAHPDLHVTYRRGAASDPDLVQAATTPCSPAVLPLPDERYWGRQIDDARYLVNSPA